MQFIARQQTVNKSEIEGQLGKIAALTPDGKEAMGQIAKDVPHLVILDRMLPNLSGDEARKRYAPL